MRWNAAGFLNCLLKPIPCLKSAQLNFVIYQCAPEGWARLSWCLSEAEPTPGLAAEDLPELSWGTGALSLGFLLRQDLSDVRKCQ